MQTSAEIRAIKIAVRARDSCCTKLVAILPLYLPHELKALLAEEADKDGFAMSEVVVRVLAKRYRRPDLATVPRKRPGRPRKEALA